MSFLTHVCLTLSLAFFFSFFTRPLYSMSAHIISPSAVCSCDPCLWQKCRALPVCVLVCLDVGGNAVGWDYCGIYVLWKIPSPCFHGNPSISVNPGDSEQASNHSRPPRWRSLTWLKSTFVLYVFKKSRLFLPHRMKSTENTILRHDSLTTCPIPGFILKYEWMTQEKTNAVQWWLSERKLPMCIDIHSHDENNWHICVTRQSDERVLYDGVIHLNRTTTLSSTTEDGEIELK